MIKEFIKRNKKLVIVIGIVLVMMLVMFVVLANLRNKGVKNNPKSEVTPQVTTEEPSITETPEVTPTPEPTLPPIPTDTPYPLPSDDLVHLDESDEGADTGGSGKLDIPDEDGVDEDGVFYQDGKWYDKDPYVDDSGEAPTGSDAKEYGEY